MSHDSTHQLAQRIDGVAVARAVREDVAREVAELKARGITPGLTVVIVGEDPASQSYVKSKEKASVEAGMKGETIRLPAETAQAELEALIDRLNADPTVHGILVQSPLPKHMDANTVVRRIAPHKDVDGFHPVNVGKLLIGEKDGFAPCTPAGVQELLVRYGISTSGKDVVVVGRSNIVGKPMASLLIQQGAGGDCTVTVCHSRTRDLAAHTRRADIVIAALGRPESITGDMIRPGAVVIDVGISRVDDPTDKRGYRIVGDVHFESASKVASHITPVPGGVGPMTIAMLLKNTVRAARQAAPAQPS
ncbi:MAG TPA: bifunctional 5,10-methylenetetrahydrofolate dehydrogenase/5,10-methenyltetrahydrofolate cyclohydrolase [Gemmatimonadaceae bacterium]|nr:MAG: bifunctional 5,10-methylene-tetrahydrofolate dehydrogenase/5,10-methylene-tetrahydrofolate cyclohydrolase [Gemmatimonadetes bacterium SCN 70-22]HMN07249.1 bifunctional 5,10-methylenetetrahydrofolate dehydrogenase/5,10-methenyltetrahydrofolate cyclohydrolase [Gemmatimonadaceae bacterium]